MMIRDSHLPPKWKYHQPWAQSKGEDPGSGQHRVDCLQQKQRHSVTWGRGTGAAASSSEVSTSCAAARGAIACHC